MDTDIIATNPPVVISREEAREKGLSRYFLGTTCKHGHTSERYVNNAVCCECRINHNKNRFSPEHHQEYLKRRKELYQENRDEILAKAKKEQRWRKVSIEKRRANYARFVKNNPEKLAATRKIWVEKNRERLREKSREYGRKRRAEGKTSYSTPAGKAAAIAYRRNRRARKKAASGTHTKQDILDLHLLQKGKCAICRKKLGESYDVDHIVPLSKGGSNDRKNLQLTHASCNRQKQAKDPLDHMRALGFLL